MKKVITIAAVALMALLTNNAFAQFSVGAGYMNTKTTSSSTFAGTTHTETYKLNGFYVEGTYTINLVGDLGLTPGLRFNTEFRSEGNSKYTFIGLDVPVYVNYGFEISKDCRLTFFVGPDFELGLVSKLKNSDLGITVSYYSEKDMGNKDYTDKRFGVGIAGGFAFSYGDWNLHFAYTLGLTNYSRTNDLTEKSNWMRVGVGYTF